MIEMSPEIISAVMLGGILVAVLITGYPLALAIGGVAFWMGIYLFGPALTFEIFYSRSYDMLNNYVLSFGVACSSFWARFSSCNGRASSPASSHISGRLH